MTFFHAYEVSCRARVEEADPTPVTGDSPLGLDPPLSVHSAIQGIQLLDEILPPSPDTVNSFPASWRKVVENCLENGELCVQTDVNALRPGL